MGLVSADWLQSNIEHVVILDARLAENYAEGHIPGAMHVDLNDLRYERDGVEGILVEPETFARVVGNLGIDRDSHLVVYDDHFNLLAARIAWSFLRYGHERISLLDGGWDAWNYPTSTQIPAPIPRQFKVQVNDAPYASLSWILERTPDTVLLDVRSYNEYANGFIPGAVFWEWQNGTDFDRTFRNEAETRAELAQLGVTPDREIVTYCQSGVRAAHTYFLLRHLGFERVRIYDGSWAEWSTRERI